MCVSRPEVKSLFSKTISFSAAVGSRVLAACWPDCESLSKRCGIIHLTGRVGSPQTVSRLLRRRQHALLSPEADGRSIVYLIAPASSANRNL